MFADSLLDSAWAGHSSRGWTTFVSFAVQGVAAVVLLCLPLFYTQALPQFQLTARLVAPTPPLAPPAAGAIRNSHPNSSNVSSDGHVIAPRFVPREIVDEPSAPPAIDISGPGVFGSTGTDRNGVLHSIENELSTVVPPPAANSTHPPRVSRMMEGNLIYRVQPQYPPLARQARIQGMVVLRAMISRAGKIENVQVISGPPLLVRSAMDAVLQWRYRPYYLNNEPVEVDPGNHKLYALGRITELSGSSTAVTWSTRDGRYNLKPVATIEIVKRTATRPTWAEVSLGTLRRNFRAVQQHVSAAVTICAIVKADAYGHGAVECAQALEQEGAHWFGVTSLDEAIPLREAGIRGRILLMTGFWRGEEEEIIRLGLTPTVWETGQIELFERAATALGVPKHPIHLKMDTGMGRLGVAPEDLPRICAALESSPHLMLEGLSTHLASSEVLDEPSVAAQLKSFEEVRDFLRNKGFNPPLIHAANTGAVISRPESWNTMVRPGIALYGYYLPFERAGREVSGTGLRLKVNPVLTWKTRILSLRDMRANQRLGYGGIYVTKAPARIAVLPVGYADGLNRRLSSQGRVIVGEHYAPIVGRISMDLTLADVTGLPGVSVGDEVVLLGATNGLSVDAREHAALASTVPYEILCGISKRVPRRPVD